MAPTSTSLAGHSQAIDNWVTGPGGVGRATEWRLSGTEAHELKDRIGP